MLLCLSCLRLKFFAQRWGHRRILPALPILHWLAKVARR
jgi:hypothetical protein